MAIAAQRRITERPLDESRYSGVSPEYEKHVGHYTEEVGRRYLAIDKSNFVSASSNDLNADPLDVMLSKGTKSEELDEVLKEVGDWLENNPEPYRAPRVTFTPTQEWEGFITHFDDHVFTAKVSDVKDSYGLPTEEVEFDIRELGPGDRNDLRLGGIVRWAIGLERLSNDQRQRVSKVHLRRLPVFTRADIDKARSRADELLQALAD